MSEKSNSLIFKEEKDRRAMKNDPRGKVFLYNGTYKGDWLDDLKHGKGIFEWSSGAIYSGDWARNRRHGHGVYTEVCPRTCQLVQYNGQWACDRRQGHGVQFYPDGESYEGEWHNNRRRGWGRMFYKDGSLYEGEWKDDIREGRGLLRKADGNMYEGTWHRDTKHGPGLYQHKRTGQTQEGVWVDGMVMCSAVEDRNRLFAIEPTPYPIPPLELADPGAVLRGAAAQFEPLIPPQYRLAPDTASSSSSSVVSASSATSTVSSSETDSDARQRCQHRYSLERCR